LKVYENRLLRRIFGLQMDKITAVWIIYTMSFLIIFTLHQDILL
jgi:hypothetical protein